MKRFLGYVVLTISGLVALIILRRTPPQQQVLLFGSFAIAFLIFIGFVFAFWVREKSNKRQHRRTYQARIAQLLDDNTLDEALANSAYTISHAQGEAGYQVSRKDDPTKLIATGLGQEEATIWVLENPEIHDDNS